MWKIIRSNTPDFEGIIPKGQYGGGTVMVWDFGRYELLGGEPVQAVSEGKLHLMLHGEKLNGEWTLVRSHRDGDEKNWFVIKTGEGIRPVSKQKEEHSALSGRTLAQIAKAGDAVWDPNHGLAAEERQKAARPPVTPAKPKRGKSFPKVGWIEPMKATFVKKAPPGEVWLFELKWDGYRAVVLKNGSEVEIFSRNHKSMTADFPEIVEAVASLPAETALLDGEICALEEQGRPSFQLLQGRSVGRDRPNLVMYAFDLLHLDGRNWMQKPLAERKKALETLLAGAPDALRFSAALEGDVEKLLAMVRDLGMEGIMGKQRQSVYAPGVRSAAWVKLKVASEQEFVIGGFTQPQGSRPHFGSVVVGYYEKEKLLFAGKVGTGFDHAGLLALHRSMKDLTVDRCPFANLPQKAGGRWSQAMTPSEMRKCTWIKPELVCQVRFAEWTNEASLRQPVFLGLRTDKSPREVVREVAR